MAALDQQVGGGDDPAIRGGQYRRIVPDADQRGLPLREPGRDGRYQPELAQIGDGNNALPKWRLLRRNFLLLE